MSRSNGNMVIKHFYFSSIVGLVVLLTTTATVVAQENPRSYSSARNSSHTGVISGQHESSASLQETVEWVQAKVAENARWGVRFDNGASLGVGQPSNFNQHVKFDSYKLEGCTLSTSYPGYNPEKDRDLLKFKFSDLDPVSVRVVRHKVTFRVVCRGRHFWR